MSVIGYDFGNLNCVIAVARKRGIDVLANEASRRTTAYVSRHRPAPPLVLTLNTV